MPQITLWQKCLSVCRCYTYNKQSLRSFFLDLKPYISLLDREVKQANYDGFQSFDLMFHLVKAASLIFSAIS